MTRSTDWFIVASGVANGLLSAGCSRDVVAALVADSTDAIFAEAMRRDAQEEADREAAEKARVRAEAEKEVAALRERFPLGSLVRNKRFPKHPGERVVGYFGGDDWLTACVEVHVEGRDKPGRIEKHDAEIVEASS